MSLKIGICVVGLGIGNAHAGNYAAMKDDVDLFVCDVNEERLKQASERYGVKGFTSYKEALQQPYIHAIDVCLPHHLHCPVAVESAKAGKHVIVEKPMARTLDEADAMIKAASDSDVVLMVAEHHRYISAVVKAKELIDDGLLGEVLIIECKLIYGNQNAWPLSADWCNKDEYRGGGVVLSDAVHRVNVLRTLGGEVASVYALQPPESYFDGEDTSLITLRFQKGSIGSLPVSWATRLGDMNSGPWFSIYGREGTIFSDTYSSLRVYSTKIEEGAENPTNINLNDKNIVYEELRDFVECIQTGRTPLVSGIDGRRDIEICLAAYQSAKTGQAVELPI